MIVKFSDMKLFVRRVLVAAVVSSLAILALLLLFSFIHWWWFWQWPWTEASLGVTRVAWLFLICGWLWFGYLRRVKM